MRKIPESLLELNSFKTDLQNVVSSIGVAPSGLLSGNLSIISNQFGSADIILNQILGVPVGPSYEVHLYERLEGGNLVLRGGGVATGSFSPTTTTPSFIFALFNTQDNGYYQPYNWVVELYGYGSGEALLVDGVTSSVLYVEELGVNGVSVGLATPLEAYMDYSILGALDYGTGDMVSTAFGFIIQPEVGGA